MLVWHESVDPSNAPPAARVPAGNPPVESAFKRGVLFWPHDGRKSTAFDKAVDVACRCFLSFILGVFLGMLFVYLPYRLNKGGKCPSNAEGFSDVSLANVTFESA